MFRPLGRPAKPDSLTRRGCWQGCQSAAALWAIGRQRESCRISRSGDVACTTGQACKALCCGDRKAGSKSLAVALLARAGAVNWRESECRRAGRHRATLPARVYRVNPRGHGPAPPCRRTARRRGTGERNNPGDGDGLDRSSLDN